MTTFRTFASALSVSETSFDKSFNKIASGFLILSHRNCLAYLNRLLQNMIVARKRLEIIFVIIELKIEQKMLNIYIQRQTMLFTQQTLALTSTL